MNKKINSCNGFQLGSRNLKWKWHYKFVKLIHTLFSLTWALHSLNLNDVEGIGSIRPEIISQLVLFPFIFLLTYSSIKNFNFTFCRHKLEISILIESLFNKSLSVRMTNDSNFYFTLFLTNSIKLAVIYGIRCRSELNDQCDAITLRLAQNCLNNLT